ncbi:MAG: type II secretion system F family protein [Thalassotalea sp.]|nr:type II secretion system F family protein [Thalassotalea sp.]
MHFQYSAYDSHGTKLESEIEAENEALAKAKLKSKGLVLVSISELKKAASNQSLLKNSKKISLQSLEFITSELAILLKSGVRLDKGLDILKKGASTPATANLLDKISGNIKSGKSISDSFAEFDDVFDALYINMIKLGEASGELELVFSRLSSDLKFRRNLQSKIIQSMTYPSVILFVCIGCILFVFNYIVPQMSSIFDRAEELPIYTRLLLSTSDWFIDYQWYLAASIALFFVAIIQGMKNDKFKRRLNAFGLKLPLVGKAIILVERIRFNSSMAMMLTSGVSLVEALKLSSSNIKNIEIQSVVKIASNKIKQGGILSDALKATPLFTEFNISLIEVGEESGELVPVFDEIADRSRQDFESWTDTLTSMIEPILILVMGAIVGSVVVVMLLSIVSTNDVGL